MNALIKFFELLIDEIIANNAMTRREAVSLLRRNANNVDDSTGGQWFQELLTIYQLIGVIGDSTWTAWRDEVVSKGGLTSKTLLSHIAPSLTGNVIMSAINVELKFKGQETAVVLMTTDIQTAEAHRDLQSDLAVLEAMNFGIREMRSQRDVLKSRIDGRL